MAEIETIALTDPGKADETLVRVHTERALQGSGRRNPHHW